MSKMGLILLSLLVAMAVSPLASASAAASTHAFVVEGTEEGSSEKLEMETISSYIELEAPIAKVSVYVFCEEGIAPFSKESIIEGGGKSKSKLELKNCYAGETEEETEKALTACKVSEPVDVKMTGELTGEEKGLGEDELKGSGAEELLIEVEIGGSSCSIKGTYKIHGSQLCIFPEPEVEGVIHELLCESDMKLESGGEPAGLSLDAELKTKGAKKWSTK
jgi:hypothetical protein